jgi:hypothetical protein
MKKILLAACGVATVFAISCKKDINADVQKPLIIGTTVDTLTGDITVNTTVTRNTFLEGIVYVRPGVTLTINPGVTIFGKTTACGVAPDLTNLKNNKGTLVVEKGGRITANGTPTSPIVWTSTNPVGSRNPGDWGGLVLLGDAPIKTTTGATTNNFEAFAALTNGRNGYGGTTPADNSGSVTYNRFEFGGGTVTAPNAEVNGVTFCGVGTGTVAHHLEVSNSGDDGFEFFGGTVNVDHLLSFSNKDDDFDFDEGYRGNLQFIIAYRTDLADNSGSEMIELDGNASGSFFPGTNRTRPFIANATLIGPASATPRANCGGAPADGRFDGGIYVRRNGRLALLNSLVISQAFPTAFATTATTNASFFGARPPLEADSSVVFNNIFQTASATPVVIDGNEGNPIIAPSPFTADNALINDLVGKGNSALGVFGDFNLGGLLENQPSSPSFSGGIDLASLGLPFVGTTERGAVISSDVWTAGAWISIATN